MMQRFLTFYISSFLAAISLFAPASNAQVTKQWDARFGGNSSDWLWSLDPTSDGGYIAGGYSISGLSGDKTQASQGGFDFWVVKTTGLGVKQWDARFGGSGSDFLFGVRQTSDGGYALAGYSASGISGDKTQASQGANDFWLVKINSLGVKQWDFRYGGSDNDYVTAFDTTVDGGYILAGYTSSGLSGDKTQASQGGLDYWMVKVDGSGVKQWDARFGGAADEYLWDVQQCSDGGFVLAGYSNSGISGDKTQASQGVNDYWIVKTNSSGVKEWDAAFGGAQEDYLYSVQQTSDGGFVLGGGSGSGISGDKTQASQGSFDFWTVKTTSLGVKEWDKGFGGTIDDILYAVWQTSDGGYALGGFSNSGISGDKTQASQGGNDYWVVRTNTTGIKQWDVRFGGNAGDQLYQLQQLPDESYILGGISVSGISGDKSQTNQGDNDFWLLKTTFDPLPISLKGFSARSVQNGVQVAWEVDVQTDVTRYIVERSANGTDFVTIGEVPPAGTVSYAFTDRFPVKGMNYYRLLIREKNGGHTYSNTVQVFVGQGNYVSVFPNPATDKLIIATSSNALLKHEINITDLTGRVIATQTIQNGRSEIDISSLHPGIYILKADGQVFRFEKR